MSVVRVRAGEPFHRKRAKGWRALFIIMFYVYILQSETSGRHYIGHTDNLERRLSEHNDPNYSGSKTTKRFKGPWKAIWTHKATTRSEAMMLEKRIKSRGVSRFLSELSR